MNILICNDDGIYSDGITALADKLNEKNEVLLVAPDSNRSAVSHSLTIFKKIKISRVENGRKYKSYAISGTPADCVKVAYHLFADFKTDIVVCGINNEHNIGSDVLYSGTVSAALEGAFFGYKTFAVSTVSSEKPDFKMCAELTEQIINGILKSGKGDVWNINFPALPKNEIKGVKITKLGKQVYTDFYEKISEDEYMLVGEVKEHDGNDEDTDVEWNKKGYVTLTPILFDKTDYSVLKYFRENGICIKQ